MPTPQKHPIEHWEAILWVSELVADLKMQINGKVPIEPITVERLAEWIEHRRDLERCMSPRKFY